MKKIFTFLVAFLTTVSGAVWGQDYQVLTSGNAVSVDGDGAYYFTTNGQQIENGGIKVTDDSPTIHLKDVNIKAGGSAIIIENGANPTIIVEGENTIMSSSDPTPAIRVGDVYGSATDVSLTIEGTGILKIEMSEDNGIAIGNCQVGGAMGPCGSVTINSSTVQTNGRIGHFTGHAFRFGGNAIVIANDIEGFDHNDKNMRRGGLLFLNDDTPYVGEFHNAADDPEFTLNSPLPEPYKIELRSDGVKLTIGNEQTLNEDQLVDNGGQIKGYKVVYSSPTDVPMNVSGQLPANKFVGSKYTVEQWNANASVKEENTTYKHIATHWLQGGTTWVSANSEVSEIPATQYTTLSTIGTKEYQAVWYLDEKTVSYFLMTGFNGAFNLWYPEVELLFDATEQSGNDLKTLAQVGLKLTDENGNTVVAGTPIAEEGTFKTNLNLASSTTNAPTGLVTKLTTVTHLNQLDLNKEDEISITFKGGDFTYNGKEQTEVGNMVSVKSVKYPDLRLTYGTHYFLKFSQDETDAKFQDKGDYTVTVVAVDGNGLLGQKKLTDKATIKPAKLTAKVNEVSWNIKDSGTPAYEEAEFTLETIYSVGEKEDEVSIDTKAAGFSASVDGETWKTTPGTYIVNYSGLTLTGSRAFNYTLEPETATGKLIVSVKGTPEDPIDDEGDNPLISGAGDWENGTRTYDGVPHPLTQIKVKNGTETAPISLADVEITYLYKQTGEAAATTPDAVKNAGTYTATFTFPTNDYGYSGTGKVSLEITKATLTVEATEAVVQVGIGGTVEESIAISNNDETQYVEFEGLVNGEQAVYTGTLKRNESVNVDTSTEGKVENAYTVDNVTLTAEGSFDPNNYTTPTYESVNVSVVVGKITINPGDDGSGEGGDEVTGGEDTDEDGDLDFILIHPEGENQCSVYDGDPHGLDVLYVGEDKYKLVEGTDYTVSYEGFGADEEPVNAGEYRATITLSEDSKYQLEGDEQSFDLIIHIVKRWVTVDFGDFPASIDIDTETLDASLYAIWQKEGEVANKGLIDGEEPIYEGTLVLTPSKEYPDYFNVYLDRETFKVKDNDPFFVNNYEINIYDEEGEKWITLEENEEGDATLPDGEDDPLVDTPDEEGGIEIEDGSSTSGGGYYQDWNDLIIYESEGATLKSRYDRMRVKDGGKFTLSLTIDEAYAGAKPVVYYRRGRGGDWTPLKISINGLYHVDNVYTDIYVKVMGDGIWVVGNEDITATDARAYAQPNKIVVITPQPTDVQIISMAGAVVATDKVTGQREFANLTEGVYIVRMGETVVKLQVRK